ncbi:hypothetical protein QYZ43_16435 [Vibrio parahaemolyticus]|nr:hypothetical protein [Vibrio parahaemolyticus]MDN4718832.1 hypothetical protein [Vibrio parahaemolyticus]MDN4720574.1 hypothetical protein [Vibrio parahaemolyticus]MDN4726357.1 hypothetical protein [Vibrio parahaemolyticus]
MVGAGKTQNTLDSFDDNLIRPVSDGCTSDEAKNYFNNGVTFTKAPVFLASKKLRKGNNGGWLRRCHVERDGVYLINEEDMNSDYERGHVLEEFSYFLLKSLLSMTYVNCFARLYRLGSVIQRAT